MPILCEDDLIASIAVDVMRQYAHQLGVITRCAQRKIERLCGTGTLENTFSMADVLIITAKATSNEKQRKDESDPGDKDKDDKRTVGKRRNMNKPSWVRKSVGELAY